MLNPGEPCSLTLELYLHSLSSLCEPSQLESVRGACDTPVLVLRACTVNLEVRVGAHQRLYSLVKAFQDKSVLAENWGEPPAKITQKGQEPCLRAEVTVSSGIALVQQGLLPPCLCRTP